MSITRERLKQIIREELEKAISTPIEIPKEVSGNREGDKFYVDYDLTEILNILIASAHEVGVPSGKPMIHRGACCGYVELEGDHAFLRVPVKTDRTDDEIVDKMDLYIAQ